MAGTTSGGIKARDKNLARDPDWYRKIGTRGGAKSRGGGFTSESARTWGYLGGRLGRRKKADGTYSNPLSPSERKRIREEFERTYKHLLEIHENR